jgi:multiple sugar transport system substrate-binding protein
MEKKFSRRDFLKLGAGGISAVVLARCAQPTPAPTEAPVEAEDTGAETEAEPVAEPVTLNFLAWGDNADIPAWDKLSAMYMEANPNVTVSVTAVADPGNNFYPKLQTSIAGGTAPDVSSFQGWEWQTYADKDLMAPIDDFIKRDGFTDPYPEGVQSITDSTVRNGKTYLIPLQLGTMVMFYIKKPFDDAGLPYPTDDWTWEEFLDLATKLTDTAADFKMYGLQANGSWFRDIGFMRGTGKQEFDSLVDPKKAMFNQPELVDIIQTVASDVFYELGIAPSPADLSGGANSFETGNCAMKYEGAWWFPRMNSPELRAENKQMEFDVVLMPKMADEGRPHRGWAEGIALMKTDNVDAAWGFASFMGGEEGDKIYSEITGRVPNSFGLIESFWLPTIEERFQVKNGQAFVKAFEHSEVDVVGGVPRSLLWSEIVKPVGWDPLINGSATAAEVLPKVDEAVQAKLDEYWAEQG